MPTAQKQNKKMTLIWISVIVLIFGLLVIPSILKRLKEDKVVDANRITMSQDAMYGVAKLSYVMGANGPRAIPDFEFIDHNGDVFSQENLKGKITVLDFFFTTCPTICPVMSKNMNHLASVFEGNDRVQFVSISINPRYDTVERLSKYKEKYNASTAQWHFLNGPVEEVYALAREGFFMIAQEDEQAPGGFEHSGLFALIDEEGFLRSSLDGFGNPIIYYRATISIDEGADENGEEEQISLLVEDINHLIEE